MWQQLHITRHKSLSSDPSVPWQTITSQPALAPGEIHLWRLDLAPDALLTTQTLSPEELGRYASYRNSAAAASFLQARTLLRRILSGYLRINPESLKLGTLAEGKPVIQEPATPIEFNLSHTADLGILAVSHTIPVGVDIEKPRQVSNPLGIAQRVLGNKVTAALLAAPDEHKSHMFLRAWTAMEARQKSLGRGIFSTRVAAEQVETFHFVPRPGFLAAVAWAAPRRTPRLHYFIHDSQ